MSYFPTGTLSESMHRFALRFLGEFRRIIAAIVRFVLISSQVRQFTLSAVCLLGSPTISSKMPPLSWRPWSGHRGQPKIVLQVQFFWL
jgi:hypothetical protein